MRDDEKKLKNLLKQEMSPKKTELFWERFEREFEVETASPWKIWIPTGVVAACLMIFAFNNVQQEINPQTNLAMFEDQEMLEELEFYADLDEELIDLEEDEWEIILADS